MSEIRLDLSVAEAILVLPAIDERATRAYTIWRQLETTNAPGDEREAARDVAALLARVAARLSSLTYPPCQWMTDPACERPAVRGENYCAFHAARLARVAV